MIKLRGGDNLPRALAALVLLAGTAPAQDNNSACTLRGKDTVIAGGATLKACLNVDALNNQTVVIPSNVDKIDNSGFALCETSVNQGGLADIVYVMDQSGSMRLTNIWISPDGRDTVFLHGTGGCTGLTSNDLNGFGTVTVLSDAGTRQVNRINPNKSVATCRDFAGDPFAQRAIAFKQAIDFQALRAPNSRAGYTGFASGLVSPIAPRQLDDLADVNAVKANITIGNNGATNYQAGLEQAKKWLTNPATSPNPSKAVIFLSDGRPTEPDSTSYLNVLSPTYAQAPGTMPPVYGIFLGRPSGDTIRLADLSQRTGGKFYLIPPNRPDSLKAVVEQILNIILKQYQPNSAVITNSSRIPNETARAGAGNFTRQSDGSWLMTLDKQVGLDTMKSNTMSVSTELRETTTGDILAKSANFTLSATGPKETTNKNLPGTQFSVVCRDLPPDINVVKVAYIRDTDGDGAGDKVFFVFTRPLLALPASIDTVYWNKVAPGFQNKVAPKLSFLPGSGNTVVVADFTASPYAKGLTSIPEGEKPIGILPQGGVFLGQRPAINDSMGPILDSGLARPYDPATSNGGGLNLDTLIIYVSEPMRTSSTWDNMLLWSKKSPTGECNDYANAKPVIPARQPVQGADQKSFTIIIAGSDAGSPVVGDCIYLNTDGTQTDIPRNIPPIHGIPLRGRQPPRQIELFRGFPPVVGFTADNPGFILVNNDSRVDEKKLPFSTYDVATGKYVISWIPPVGYTVGQPFNPFIPANPGSLPVNNLDAGRVAVPFPRTISAIQVVSTGKYIANVSIYDTQGRFIKSFRQAFGYQGELNNGARTASRGMVSYLVWDLKDSKGQKAGQGVYVWKVLFDFENGKQEIQYTRTGVMRHPEWWLAP